MRRQVELSADGGCVVVPTGSGCESPGSRVTLALVVPRLDPAEDRATRLGAGLEDVAVDEFWAVPPRSPRPS